MTDNSFTRVIQDEADAWTVTKPAAPAAKEPTVPHGFWVFPCAPGTKVPALEGDWRGHSTQDEAQIAAWRAAGYNLAVDCGKSDLAVIDLDGGTVGETSWLSLQAANGRAPDTFTMRTPKGGKHHYFRGECQTSVGKLGSKVDTRGAGTGYAVFEGVVDQRSGKPPSDWGSYSVYRAGPIAALPEWIPAKLYRRTKERAAVDELDLPQNVSRAIAYLEGLEPVSETQGADAKTYEVACLLHDFGVSAELSVDLMLKHYKCWPQDERFEAFITRKVENAWDYAQNEAGAKGIDTAGEVFADAIAALAAAEGTDTPPATEGADPELERARRELPAYSPSSGATRPKLDFWPGTCDLIPKGGSAGRIGFLVAPSHQGKSTIEIALLLDACLAGARILFCAGEGADDIMAQQLPAACQARGVALDDLTATGRWLTVEGVPLLSDQALVNGFVKLYHDHRPDIVAFDTWATAIMGLKEDSAETGGLLTGNGAVGVLARSWKATILLAHHTGKDESRGGRGSSSFHSNTDFTLILAADKLARVSTVLVDKMRGGRRGLVQDFAVDEGWNRIGVATPIDGKTAAQRRGRVTPADKARGEVAAALLSLAEAGEAGPVSAAVLAEEIFRLREERRAAAADDADEAYDPPSADEVTSNLESIRTNVLSRKSREIEAKDGKPAALAVLDRYIAKNRDGERLTPLKFCLPIRPDTGNIGAET